MPMLGTYELLRVLQIGAVNTLVRQEDGSLKGYNTDWSAAIAAIERGLDPGESSAAAVGRCGQNKPGAGI